MNLPVEISDKALEEIKNIIAHKNIPSDYGVRIGVRGGGGCSVAGMNYMLGFDKKKATDKEFNYNGISIYIERAHFMYVIGTKVEYVTDNDKTGFIFDKSE